MRTMDAGELSLWQVAARGASPWMDFIDKNPAWPQGSPSIMRLVSSTVGIKNANPSDTAVVRYWANNWQLSFPMQLQCRRSCSAPVLRTYG